MKRMLIFRLLLNFFGLLNYELNLYGPIFLKNLFFRWINPIFELNTLDVVPTCSSNVVYFILLMYHYQSVIELVTVF